MLNVSVKIGDKVYKNNNTVHVLSDGTFKVGISVVDLGASNYAILVEGASTADYNNVSMSKNIAPYLSFSTNSKPDVYVLLFLTYIVSLNNLYISYMIHNFQVE